MVSYLEAFKKSLEYFNGDELAAQVFVGKYALTTDDGEIVEQTPDDMHHRLAKEFARIEEKYPNPLTEKQIYELLKKFKYIIPQGSPMAGIGNHEKLMTLGNCYVVEPPWDSYSGILKTDQELAQLMKRRAGVGTDISNIRPRGMRTSNAAGTTDGISVFMERFSNTCREVAQCIAENQKVLTKNGLKAIQDVAPGEDEVWTKQGWVKVLNVLNNGKKETFKVTTKSGFEISTTEDHIYGVPRNGEIKEERLKNLKINDEIVLLPGTSNLSKKDYVELDNDNCYKHKLHNTNLSEQYSLPKYLNEDLSYILGYSYGDGHVEKDKFNEPNVLSFACSNDYPKIKNIINCNTKKLFEYDIKIKNGDGQCEKLNIHSKKILHFLEKNSLLKEKSANIEVPAKIWNSPPSVQHAFIAGYFDADGYASGSKKGYCFASINVNFLKSIQTILFSNGIASKIHMEDRTKFGWNNLYSLVIVGSSAQKNFINTVGEYSIKTKTSGFIAKRDNWITPYLSKTLNINRNNYSFINEQPLSANSYMRLKEDSNQNHMFELTLKDTISSIEKNDVVNTYDLVLEKEHMFWCEGFYVHNSGRRGALMITISVHHPEIETFITIKQDLKKVTGANISIRLSDEFMTAVKKGEKYHLRWPVDSSDPKVSNWVDARKIWDLICSSAWSSAEPGLLFWDNILKESPAKHYKGYEDVSTNPCSELNLSSNDSCRLLLLNTTSYVKNPYTNNAYFDHKLFAKHSRIAQRLMDDLVDLELECIGKIINKIDSDPEPENIKKVEKDLWEKIYDRCAQGRRTGLGVTGIGDTIASLNQKYGSDASISSVEQIYKTLAINSYKESCNLAKERGTFTVFSHEAEKQNPFIQRILKEDSELAELYNKYGRRNIANLTTAPCGSVSILSQTTSGIEPAYLLSYKRRRKINPNDKNARVDFVDSLGDKWQEYKVYHHGFKKWMEITGKSENDLEESSYYGATSNDIDWIRSVDLQAAAQRWVDHSISKTCNLPKNTTIQTVKDVYMRAYEMGCKGFTIYRDGSRTGVLVSDEESNNNSNTNNSFSDHHAPKRPEKLACDIYHTQVKGEKWNFFVGLYNERPYEIFAGRSKHIHLPKNRKNGYIKKNGVYNLYTGEGENELVIEDLATVFENPTESAFTRTVSLALRHGAPVQYIVEQIEKGADKENEMFSLSKGLMRVLKNYIKNGTKASVKKCPKCEGEELAYQEGCLTCQGCGYSKCS